MKESLNFESYDDEKLRTAISSIKRQITRLKQSRKPAKIEAAKHLVTGVAALNNRLRLVPVLEVDVIGGALVYDVWRCPNCDTAYEFDEKYNYCPNCGQAIDWSYTE